MFFKKSETKIKFYASIEGIEKHKSIIPYPAKKYIPSWWTNIPNQHNDWPTIRRCPAVPDFFSQGYILPMWRNIKIFEMNKEKQVVFSIMTNDPFKEINGHSDNQFLSHYSPRVGDREIDTVIKFDSPWNIITPKGWSTLVLPLFYEFNPYFTILPGVVDTDIFHQMNHPALLHSNGKHFELKSGDPLLMYIPFKRTKTNYEIISKNFDMDNHMQKITDDWIRKQELESGLGFGFKNAYRKMQKEKRNDF